MTDKYKFIGLTLLICTLMLSGCNKNDPTALKEIKKLQIKTIKKSKSFQKDLDKAMKNPELGWREWNNMEAKNE